MGTCSLQGWVVALVLIPSILNSAPGRSQEQPGSPLGSDTAASTAASTDHADGESLSDQDAGVGSVETSATPIADREPSTAPADLTPDPALDRLRSELSLLAMGTAPKSSDIDSLFSIPLDDPKALKRYAKGLPSEILQLQERADQLKLQLSNPEALAPVLETPSILASIPTAPTPPVAPTEPTKPTRNEIRAYVKAKGKTTDSKEDPRLVYKKTLAAFEQDEVAYQEALKTYEADRAAYEEALSLYQQTKKTYHAAAANREKSIKNSIKELHTELHNIQNRIAIAKLRQSYLVALAGILERLSEPALEMFQALKSQRTSLRKRAETIERLTGAADDLLGRIRVLYLRAEAGSLVGFQVQRDELSENLSEEAASFEQRIKKGRLLASDLIGEANEIETNSLEQRLLILVTAMSPKVNQIMDRTFQTRLTESRRASRVPTGFAVTDAELVDIRSHLGQMLSTPKSITTVADGERILREIKGVGEQLDQVLDVIHLGRDRYRQAYKREIVTIYASLASPEVKNRAYSFSYALLDDFIADMNLLRVDLSLWAEERLNSVSGISEDIRSGKGQLRIARVGGGLMLILLMVIMRHRIRNRMARLILRLINLRAFKRRAGLVVRLTVFILALMPIALVAISGYALLGLIGLEYPEVKITEIAFRWGLVYLVGRQIVLGLTRRERSGRPPLFEISERNFELLRMTYARLGLFLVIIAAADEWSREWMGTGSLNTMVRFVASGWLAVWILWALIAWRKSVASSCFAQSENDSFLHRMAAFSGARRIGVVLTPFLFVWLVAVSLFRASRKLLAEGNLLAYLRARALRRLSRRNQGGESIVPALALPGKYIEQFPLYPLHGEEGEVLLPRRPQMASVMSQLDHWRATRQDGSLVLVGEKGIGKTTFLALLEREIAGIPVSRHIFAKKLRTEQELLHEMRVSLRIDATNIEALAGHFNEQEPQVVLLDEAHNIFLRTVDGFRAVNALVSLVDATSDKVFWVLVFNSYSWAFLNKANRHVRAFRKVLKLPPWSQSELKELVAKRNERSGLEVEFDEILLDAESSSTGGFELISSADGFFRLLWEASRGNPRVATYLWLNALSAMSETRIRVGLIREEDSDFLSGLDSGMLFALASMAQHENLSFDELGRALNVTGDEAVFAAHFLLEYGLLEPKHTDRNRYTLSPRFHQQVLRTLRSNHLLYLEE